MRIVILTDSHLLADDAPHREVVPTAELLAAAIDDAGRRLADQPADLVVMAGDISDDGSVSSYVRACELVAPFADRMSAPVLWVPGNHDQRAPLREGVASEHFVGLEGLGDDSHAPVISLAEVDGTRVVGLDTSVPGAGYGLVADTQLAWLREVLATPAPGGTVLVLHHSVAPPPTLLHEALRLANPADVIDAVAGSDVGLLISGHYHLAGEFSLTVGGSGGAAPWPEAVRAEAAVGASEIPVVVGRALANEADTSLPHDWEGAMWGSGYTVVDWDGTSCAVTDVRVPHARDGERLFAFDPEEAREIGRTEGRPGWEG